MSEIKACIELSYRKFIENYSQKTAPLTVLLKGKRVLKGKQKNFIPVKLNWTEKLDVAFENIKSALLKEVVSANCLQNVNLK